MSFPLPPSPIVVFVPPSSLATVLPGTQARGDHWRGCPPPPPSATPQRRRRWPLTAVAFFMFMHDVTIHRVTIWGRVTVAGPKKKQDCGTKWHKTAQSGTNRHKLAQTGTNWHKPAQTSIFFCAVEGGGSLAPFFCRLK